MGHTALGRGIPIGRVIASCVPRAIRNASISSNVSECVLTFRASRDTLAGEIVRIDVGVRAAGIDHTPSGQGIPKLAAYGTHFLALVASRDVPEVTVRADRDAHASCRITEVIPCTAGVAFVDERVSKEASRAISQASSIGIREGPIWASVNAFHGYIVDESTSEGAASCHTLPGTGLILDEVARRTNIDAKLHIRIGVGIELDSADNRAVLNALATERISIVVQRTVLRP